MNSGNFTQEYVESVLIQNLFYAYFLHLILVAIGMALFVTYKVLNGLGHLRNNPIMLIYFAVLYVGIILRIVEFGYAMYNLDIFIQVAPVLNALYTLSAICYESFYTLIPNIFFSVSHSKLTQLQKGYTRKYMYTNLTITGIFLIIIIFICSFLSELWPSDIVQILEIFYTIGFYSTVLYDLRNANTEVNSKLWKFFSYYICFAVINIICSVFRAIFPSYIAEDLAMHHVGETVLLITFTRSLSKIKMKGLNTEISS